MTGDEPNPNRSLDVRLIPAAPGSYRSARTLRRVPALSRRRIVTAWMLLLIGLPVLLALMALDRTHLKVGTVLLLTLSLTVIVAATGGLLPGLVGAVCGALAVNWFLVPPYGTLDVHDQADTLSLAVFVLVGVVVSTLVGQVARRSSEADKARRDTEALNRSAMLLATSGEPVAELADEVRNALRLDDVAIFQRSSDGGWDRLAAAGSHPPVGVADGVAHPVDDLAQRVLVLHGRDLDSNDVTLLDGLADQIIVALDTVALRREAAEAEVLGRANELRNAILQAVSHDLRTPLTGIKASVSSLLSPEVQFGPDDTALLLSTIDRQVDRLDRVVGNLLDMSRLHSGVLQVRTEETSLEEVVASAVSSLGLSADRVDIRIPRDLQPALIDGSLAERAVANVLANAKAVQPEATAIRVEATSSDDDPGIVELQVVDRGPGIAPVDRERSLLPFQRLDDSQSHVGVGLGLAIANGLTDAVGGTLELTGTPGGGLTVTFRFPAVNP